MANDELEALLPDEVEVVVPEQCDSAEASEESKKKNKKKKKKKKKKNPDGSTKVERRFKFGRL